MTHSSGTLGFSHLFIAAEAELALLVESRLYLGNRKSHPDASSIALEAAHWAYNHFINLSALHLGLTPSLHFTHWPKTEAAQDGADPARAYRSLVNAKDLWQNPQPHGDEPVGEIIEYREATPEEVDNVA